MRVTMVFSKENGKLEKLESSKVKDSVSRWHAGRFSTSQYGRGFLENVFPFIRREDIFWFTVCLRDYPMQICLSAWYSLIVSRLNPGRRSPSRPINIDFRKILYSANTD